MTTLHRIGQVSASNATKTSSRAGFARIFRGQTAALIIMLPPALTLFTLFVAWPFIDAAYYSVFKWNGYGSPTDFIGLGNFKQIFQHDVFFRAVFNALIILFASLFIQLPFALGLALLIYKKTPTNAVFRLFFFLPFIIAEIASGLIWGFIFDGDSGLAAVITHALHTQPYFLLTDRTWAFFGITLVVMWKYFGFHMMIYVAALQGVPVELVEAARIEGARRWQIVTNVLVPMIKPAIGVSVFFAIVGSLQLFDVVIPLTNGGPSNATHTIVTYLYTFGLTRMRIGFGSAVGVILFVVAFSISLLYQRYLVRRSAQ
ncbi:carbohydrate ABC transporter membrane protein 1, CUT1 family (TC 3.A.1.1.-) [Paraburkholderia steynii]|uniref:Carbohydrate ABC transporter membrane protein 1, CUT1 family (TC 3.A.1.1.-) n=1 Tax=Paraburkholderia steynii TaxID=1245441 RepID=A0A7Z7BE12_9BURK|nr:sugar ABC transporter permease [Paraburkholderia steynii]SDI56359.1 carbohydrate ABC transporter membrane protein 1, CUT1 family (TC 3.A.1.1.-) [Paraburkholderia steynii]